MTETKPTLQECAMRYGTLMGVFWTLKFILFPLGMKMPLFLMAFFLLTLAGPVIGYFLVRRFRDNECNGQIAFSKAFLFTCFMYLFAALFTAVTHYIYFRYIDNGLIIGTYQDMLGQMAGIAQGTMKQSVDQFQQALDLIATLSPLDITLELITQNLLNCTMIALPTALIVKRNLPKE